MYRSTKKTDKRAGGEGTETATAVHTHSETTTCPHTFCFLCPSQLNICSRPLPVPLPLPLLLLGLYPLVLTGECERTVLLRR